MRKKVIECMEDKRQITAMFAGTLSGEFLPIQVLYQGRTERVHPRYRFAETFDIWHTPNHWANKETTLRYLEKVIIPYIQQVRELKQLPDQPALAIF